MTRLPIEYFTAKLTRHNALLQWIEFRGGHHWLRRSEQDCEFKIGMASEVFDVRPQSITVEDSFGTEFEVKITPGVAPDGFPDFDYLPNTQRAILNVKIWLGETSLDRLPFHFYAETPEDPKTHVFTVEPSMIYPTFLFDAVQNYGPLLAERFGAFVETGSLYGHTLIHASYYFDEAYSIELSKELFEYIKPVERVLPKIRIFNGNTAEVLPDIIKRLNGPAVFFLDAHWSGDYTTDWEKSSFTGYPSDTAHMGDSSAPTPNEQKPILKELDTILNSFDFPALIIVDDWNIVGAKGADVFEKFDWSHISHASLRASFDKNSRIKFHCPLDESRYIIGIAATLD